jgi:hypothetical protein
MGSHPKQAVALILFLIAFALLADAMAGAGIVAGIPGLVLLGVSIAMLIKVKPLEHIES